MEERKKELMDLIPDESKPLVADLVEHIVGMEMQLDELGKLPKISVNPKNPFQQRVLPAQKTYKEMMQQYINAIKILESIIYRDRKLTGEEEEESPLRRWFNEH